MIRFPNDQFGNRIPLARKSVFPAKGFRAICFCGSRSDFAETV
jgi:hypothetical protein